MMVEEDKNGIVCFGGQTAGTNATRLKKVCWVRVLVKMVFL
jgi:hypothetical protein